MLTVGNIVSIDVFTDHSGMSWSTFCWPCVSDEVAKNMATGEAHSTNVSRG